MVKCTTFKQQNRQSAKPTKSFCIQKWVLS